MESLPQSFRQGKKQSLMNEYAVARLNASYREEEPKMSKRASDWDYTTDVLVAGYACAGAIAAITAHDAGSKVLLVEKMTHAGGLAVLCGGGVIVANNAEKAETYMRITLGGRTPDDVMRTFVKGLTELEAYLVELVENVGLKIRKGRHLGMQKVDLVEGADDPVQYSPSHLDGTYPFPGTDAFASIKIDRIPGFTGFPWAGGPSGRHHAGPRLWKVVSDNVEHRNIEAWYSSPIRELVMDADRRVIGALIEREGKVLRVRATQAVILATGGFENNDEMKRNFFEVPVVFPVSSLQNTGDGIRIAQQAGAALWHMWFFHGGYGVKLPNAPVAFHNIIWGPRDPQRKMPWVLVDKYGRRFMDEYPPDVSDTSVRFLQYFDPDRQEHPRIPSYMIFDSAGREVGPIVGVSINNPEALQEDTPRAWSADNLAEVEQGYIKTAATIDELGKRLGLDPHALAQTVNRWNSQCALGRDDDFGRLPGTMMPIVTPPFYGIDIWPIIYNTQGGPKHNAKQQVIDSFGNPIPGLYAVGELGSLFGHLYLLGGNISECFISGRIAGEEAASQPELKMAQRSGTHGE